MVGRRTLDPLILVRFQVPQPIRLVALAHGYSSERIVLSDGERSRTRVEGNFHMSYFVYILRTSSNTLYIGQTNNLEKRINEHKSKNSRSAKYMKYFQSFELAYSETYNSRIEAMRREHQLKSWTRSKKEALIQGNEVLLKKL